MTEVVLVSGADQTRIRKLCELYLQHKGTDYDVLWKTSMTTGCQMPTWLGPAALLLPGPSHVVCSATNQDTGTRLSTSVVRPAALLERRK